ncbi:hypothetical protein [Haloferula sargassicola]|uniref:Uncharacterized protein n=1 Tax=Haloferula sargassicola TaxID=490096 RepID=A0ABP9UHR2_9BACT
MKWILLFLLMFTLAPCRAIVSPPEEEAAALEEWKTKIENCGSLPDAEKFGLLIEAINKLHQPSIYANQAASLPVHQRAVAALSSSEGYADYFADRIRGLKHRGLEENSPAYHRYLTERRWIFSALSQIHTPEMVEMFAGFLDDNDERRLPDLEATLGQASASKLAGMLEDPPVNSSSRMDLWLEWRDRVREGKQTYAFKGSKKRYDFQGEVMAPPPRPRRSFDERNPEPVAESGKKPPRSPVAVIAGTLLVLALAAAFWKWRTRPTR